MTRTIALSGCSNPPTGWRKEKFARLVAVFEGTGYRVDTRIFDRFAAHGQRSSGRVWRICPHTRADLLMELYADDAVALAREITGLPIWHAPHIGHSADAAPVTIGAPAPEARLVFRQ